MSDRTGVIRGARTLSGADVGRIWVMSDPLSDYRIEWEILKIVHDHRGVELTLSRTGDLFTFLVRPTDTVTIRGRDE